MVPGWFRAGSRLAVGPLLVPVGFTVAASGSSGSLRVPNLLLSCSVFRRDAFLGRGCPWRVRVLVLFGLVRVWGWFATGWRLRLRGWCVTLAMRFWLASALLPVSLRFADGSLLVCCWFSAGSRLARCRFAAASRLGSLLADGCWLVHFGHVASVLGSLCVPGSSLRGSKFPCEPVLLFLAGSLWVRGWFALCVQRRFVRGWLAP